MLNICACSPRYIQFQPFCWNCGKDIHSCTMCRGCKKFGHKYIMCDVVENFPVSSTHLLISEYVELIGEGMCENTNRFIRYISGLIKWRDEDVAEINNEICNRSSLFNYCKRLIESREEEEAYRIEKETRALMDELPWDAALDHLEAYCFRGCGGKRCRHVTSSSSWNPFM